MDFIQLTVINKGESQNFEAPNDMGLNLMEFLKACEYEEILGTCGGLALCATCHVKVHAATPDLHEQSDDEYNMLETLPIIYDNSRLACQIKLTAELESITVEIPEK